MLTRPLPPPRSADSCDSIRHWRPGLPGPWPLSTAGVGCASQCAYSCACESEEHWPHHSAPGRPRGQQTQSQSVMAAVWLLLPLQDTLSCGLHLSRDQAIATSSREQRRGSAAAVARWTPWLTAGLQGESTVMSVGQQIVGCRCSLGSSRLAERHRLAAAKCEPPLAVGGVGRRHRKRVLELLQVQMPWELRASPSEAHRETALHDQANWHLCLQGRAVRFHPELLGSLDQVVAAALPYTDFTSEQSPSGFQVRGTSCVTTTSACPLWEEYTEALWLPPQRPVCALPQVRSVTV